ncbi:hypothetical protein D3C72_1068500 [compost metagenome]
MERDSQKKSYFVDDKFSVSELDQISTIVSSGAEESTVIKNIELYTSNIARFSITITVNANVDSGSSIKGYIFLLNGNVIDISTGNTYIFQNLIPETTYDIKVIAIDNIGKMKSKSFSETTFSNINTQYAILEIYDHIGGVGGVINELEFYDDSNKLINYTVLNTQVYDSATNGLPAYWNQSTWPYTNLNDGQIGYSSNSEGGANCTIFHMPTISNGSNSNTDHWARLIVDFGSKKNINLARVAVGNVESRTPKTVSIYSVDNYTTDTYANNIKQRNNTGLTLMGIKTFTSLVTAPTYYNLY